MTVWAVDHFSEIVQFSQLVNPSEGLTLDASPGSGSSALPQLAS